MISRRQFIVATASSLLLPKLDLLPKLALAKPSTQLQAEPVELDLISGKPTTLWGFNGSSPGPPIYVKKGKRLQVHFTNSVNQPSSIHWHGIRIDNKMDGVPELTQDAVESGDSFDYDFVVPDSGTYWYHAHNRSWEQVARGLYGALIVEEQTPPKVDHDIIIFVDDWRLNKDGSQAGDFENEHDQSHEGRLGNYAKAILQAAPAMLKRNERVRLRFINAATDRIFQIGLEGLEGKIVAYDGMPLSRLMSLDKFSLAPAQRLDVIADVIGDELIVNFLAKARTHRLASLPVDGEISKKNSGKIEKLEPNDTSLPSLANAKQVILTLTGGVMHHGMMRMMQQDIWALNGLSGLKNKPYYKFEPGQTGIINLINATNFPHAMHLHGHHFSAVEANRLGPLRDTILIEARQNLKVVCNFDNPGKWLLHCHMLAHQASGMTTWLKVG